MIGIRLSKDDLLIALPCVEHTVNWMFKQEGDEGTSTGLTYRKKTVARIGPPVQLGYWFIMFACGVYTLLTVS